MTADLSSEVAQVRLNPGDTIGILGGGQLGRMLAMAASQLGLRSHIFCPDRRSPAFEVADAVTCADYTDEGALAQFTQSVGAVTYEFENIPAETVAYVTARRPLRPSNKALVIIQDRLSEKDFLNSIGVPTAPYKAISSPEDLAKALGELGTPAIAKTRLFGYDGKGQTKLDSPGQVADAWDKLGTAKSILEGFVPFNREVSVIVARDMDGRVLTWPVTENVHVNHILDTSTVPATVSDTVEQTARTYAARVAEELEYVGVLAVEFFVLDDSDTVIANEIAPRVHNSGHWTLEGAVTSQFENHIRAIAGWPLGATEALGRVRMKNLIGDEVKDWRSILSDPAAHLHLYGKQEARPGRKMGHVTWLEV